MSLDRKLLRVRKTTKYGINLTELLLVQLDMYVIQYAVNMPYGVLSSLEP